MLLIPIVVPRFNPVSSEIHSELNTQLTLVLAFAVSYSLNVGRVCAQSCANSFHFHGYVFMISVELDMNLVVFTVLHRGDLVEHLNNHLRGEQIIHAALE